MTPVPTPTIQSAIPPINATDTTSISTVLMNSIDNITSSSTNSTDILIALPTQQQIISDSSHNESQSQQSTQSVSSPASVTTSSQFALPVWALVLIGVGGFLLANLIIFGIVFGVVKLVLYLKQSSASAAVGSSTGPYMPSA